MTAQIRKTQARKLIEDEAPCVTIMPDGTQIRYNVLVAGYTIHFLWFKERMTYLGETTPDGEFI